MWVVKQNFVSIQHDFKNIFYNINKTIFLSNASWVLTSSVSWCIIIYYCILVLYIERTSCLSVFDICRNCRNCRYWRNCRAPPENCLPSRQPVNIDTAGTCQHWSDNSHIKDTSANGKIYHNKVDTTYRCEVKSFKHVIILKHLFTKHLHTKDPKYFIYINRIFKLVNNNYLPTTVQQWLLTYRTIYLLLEMLSI